MTNFVTVLDRDKQIITPEWPIVTLYLSRFITLRNFVMVLDSDKQITTLEWPMSHLICHGLKQ